MKKLLGIVLCAFAGMGVLTAAYQYGDNVSYLGENQLIVTRSADLTMNFLPSQSTGFKPGQWDYLVVQATANGKLTTTKVAMNGADPVDIGSYSVGTNLMFQLSNDTYTTTLGRLANGTWDSAAGMSDHLLFDGNWGINTERYVDVAFRIGEGTPAPSGQPLPGVAMALLLGGGMLGATRFGKMRFARKTASL